MTLQLTERQERLWRFIASCHRSPTYDEMAKALGDPVRGSGVYRAVNALEAKGYVRRIPRRARSIVALEPILPTGPVIGLESISTPALVAECCRRGIGVVMVPLYGRIA